MLRCGGCGELTSEWAWRCARCGRGTEGAPVADDSLVTSAAEVGAALLGATADRGPAPAVARAADDGTTPAPTPWRPDASRSRARPHRRRLVGAAVVVVLAAAGVGGGWAASRPGTGPTIPAGRVLSWSAAGALVTTSATGSGGRSLPSPTGPGVVRSPDGRYLATGEGVELAGPSLLPTGASVPFDGPPGSWRAVGFTDHDLGLAGTETGLDGTTHAEVVTFADHTTVQLGGAQSVVGDPGALGVIAVLPGPDGPSVERRDAGTARVELADAAGLLVDLHAVAATNEAFVNDIAARSVAVAALPSPDGDRIAISVVGVAGSSVTGIVVVDRAGAVVGVLRLGTDSWGQPAWSPDGATLVLGSTVAGRHGRSVPGVLTWRPGHRPVPVAAPVAAGTTLDDCLWLSDATYLCAAGGAAGDEVAWVLGRPGGTPVRREGPELPVAWIPTRG